MKKRGKASHIPGQPSKKAFLEFARQHGIDPVKAADQWDIWDAGDWCDGNSNPILNWKSKLVTYEKRGFGMFSPNFAPKHWEHRERMQKKERDRVAEAKEEYEQRQRHKPDDL